MKEYRIFISLVLYSQDASRYKNDLIRHLRPFTNSGDLEVWDEKIIEADARWNEVISEKIAKCDCAILLLSPDFLRSDFCEGIELRTILKRFSDVDVLPIYTIPCAWELIPTLRELQVFPKKTAICQTQVTAEQDTYWKTIVEKLFEFKNRGAEKHKHLEKLPNLIPAPELSKLALAHNKPDSRFGPLINKLNDYYFNEEISLCHIYGHRGIGKTSLVRVWIESLEIRKFPDRYNTWIFGWTFNDNYDVNSQVDGFFINAARYFGIDLPEDSRQWPSALINILIHRPSIIILDNLFSEIKNPNLVHSYGSSALLVNFLRKVQNRSSMSNHLVVTISIYPAVEFPVFNQLVSQQLVLAAASREQIKEMLTPLLKDIDGDISLVEKIVDRSDGRPNIARRCLLATNAFTSSEKYSDSVRDPNFCLHKLDWSGNKTRQYFMWMVSLFNGPIEADEKKYLLEGIFKEKLPPVGSSELDSLERTLTESAFIYRSTTGTLIDAEPEVRQAFREDFQKRDPDLWRKASYAFFRYSFDKRKNESGEPLNQLTRGELLSEFRGEVTNLHTIVSSPHILSTPNDYVPLTLTIDKDYESYDVGQAHHLLKTLSDFLRLDRLPRILNIEKGSVKLTIEIPIEQAKKLIRLHELGMLGQLSIEDARIIGDASAAAVITEKIKENEYDVFMCHNNEDKPEVKKIALNLRSKGVLPWLDEWELRPGLPWQLELERQIENIKSAAVFVGNSGIGPWQNMEVHLFIKKFIEKQCPVVPAILKSCKKTPDIPIFLDGMTWVDFHKRNPNPYEHLVWGITGVRGNRLCFP